jgi:hypothetical protein
LISFLVSNPCSGFIRAVAYKAGENFRLAVTLLCLGISNLVKKTGESKEGQVKKLGLDLVVTVEAASTVVAKSISQRVQLYVNRAPATPSHHQGAAI